MCVICYKPKGVEMPSKEILTAMYNANSDGCGFCTPSSSFRSLSFNSFYKRLQEVRQEEPCIIHFRYATHGSVRRANCHPFYDKKMCVFFAHNGVLSICPDRDKTDSETAFRHLFLPLIHKYGLRSDELKETAMQVRANTGSKFAFMQGGDVLLVGDFVKWGRYFVSNTRFLWHLKNKNHTFW